MPIKPDFYNILTVFVYNNLPLLMNPTNVFLVTTTPATPSSIVDNTTLTSLATSNVITIDPNILQALQTAANNNFNSLGLPPDIQQIAANFFANLPSTVVNTKSTSAVTIATS